MEQRTLNILPPHNAPSIDSNTPLDLEQVAQDVEAAIQIFIAAGFTRQNAGNRRGLLTYLAGWLQLRYQLTLHDGALPTWVAAQFTQDHLAQELPDGLSLTQMPESVDRRLVAARIKLKKGPLAYNTVKARLILLGQWHRLNDWPDPTNDEEVRHLLRQALVTPAMARRSGSKSLNPPPSLRSLLSTCGDDLWGVRDRALLLLAWDSKGHFRREAADLKVEDVCNLLSEPGSYKLWGEALSTNAALALRAWLEAAPTPDGPLFRRLFRCGKVSLVGLSVNQMLRVAQRHERLAGAASRWSGLRTT